MSAIWVAAAGVAVNAIGAGVSAYGAAKSADAIAEANADNARREQELYERQQKAINKLSNRKMDKLSNLGNIFDRMESTGAFGSGDTLKNLRQAQSDYSALAAGDFSGFENQLRQSLSDSLIATAGAGAPIGTFAGLAAQDQMNLRNQGIQTTMGISEYLSKEAYQLLGNEFGIMDQKFEVGYKLDRDRTTNMSNYALGQAATEGVGMTAYGNAGQQIGAGITTLGNTLANRETIKTSNENQLRIAEMAYSRQAGITPNTIDPVTGMPLGTEGALAAYRASLNAGGTYGQNTGVNNLNAINTGVNNFAPGSFPTIDLTSPASNVRTPTNQPINGGAPARTGTPWIDVPNGVPIDQGDIRNYDNTFGPTSYNTTPYGGSSILSGIGSRAFV